MDGTGRTYIYTSGLIRIKTYNVDLNDERRMHNLTHTDDSESRFCIIVVAYKTNLYLFDGSIFI